MLHKPRPYHMPPAPGSLSCAQAFTKFLKKHAKIPFTLPKKGKGDSDDGAHADKDEL